MTNLQKPPRELTPDQRREYIRAVIDYLQPGMTVRVYDFKNDKSIEFIVSSVNRRDNAVNFKGHRPPTDRLVAPRDQDVPLSVVMLPDTPVYRALLQKFTPPQEVLNIPKLSREEYIRAVLDNLHEGDTVKVYDSNKGTIGDVRVTEVLRRRNTTTFKGVDLSDGIIYKIALVSVYRPDIRGPGIPANIIDKHLREGVPAAPQRTPSPPRPGPVVPRAPRAPLVPPPLATPKAAPKVAPTPVQLLPPPAPKAKAAPGPLPVLNEGEVTITYIEKGMQGLDAQGEWMRDNLPIEELGQCGIKVGLMRVAATEYDPEQEFQVLVLPSGKMLEVWRDMEGNGPGALVASNLD